MIGTMIYRGYTGTVDFNDADGDFCGEVLGHTCISYSGVTLAELREDFQDAIDEFLSTIKSNQRGQNNEKKTVSTGIIPFPGGGALRPGPGGR